VAVIAARRPGDRPATIARLHPAGPWPEIFRGDQADEFDADLLAFIER
jgi:hypothetical protein